MKLILLAAVMLKLFLCQPDYAHEGKKHTSVKKEHTADSGAVKNKNTPAGNSSDADSTKQYEEISEKPYRLNVFHEVTEHLHNKIVHFTVAFSLAAFLFTLINFKWKSYDSAIKILVTLSAVSALLSVFTGLNQAGIFREDPKQWVVELHEKWGFASGILILFWGALLIIKPLKRYAWIMGLIVFIVISVTGFLGGIAAH